MLVHYSKFPTDAITQKLLAREGIGAVVACWSGRIYGKDPSNLHEDYDHTDTLIRQAQALNLDIHLHPVLTRYDRNGLEPHALFWAHLEKAKAIIHRYANVTDRLTIACELTLAPVGVWAEVIRLYAWAARHYPHLQLWIGDYGIYNQERRVGLLSRLRELKAIVPALSGFIGQDYVDLDYSTDKIARYFKASVLGVVPLIKFSYLPGFIGDVQGLGLEFALEHSTFSNTDTPIRRLAQQSIYRCLSRACDRAGAEFWLWDCCDASAKYFHVPERKVYAGLWDEDGKPRLLLG